MKTTRFLATLALAAAPPLASASAADVYASAPADAPDTFSVGVKARGDLVGTGAYLGAVPLDADGTELAARSELSTQLRVGATVKAQYMVGHFPIALVLDGEGDFLSGPQTEGTDVEGVDLPGTEGSQNVLRSAHAVLAFGNVLQLGAGVMTSQWGMGLLANSGTTDWKGTGDFFTDRRGGDIVRRAFVATGPWTPHKLSVFAFVDKPEQDDTLRDGDDAEQIGGGFRFAGTLARGGLYYVHRTVDAEDGDQTVADVFDVHLASDITLGEGLKLILETETALIRGTTDLASTTDFVEHDLKQFGWAARATLDAGEFGGVLDFVYASGDQNFDDNEQNAFKADPNYQQGLFLFRQVIAGQTGRAPVTASDLELVGRPSEDLDRFSSRGSITNTVSFFPKGYWRPVSGLTLYGGALLAFAEGDVADPLNTRLAGGDPRNALAGDPGAYLGTEFDLGVRYQYSLSFVGLGAGLEGGVLLPGSALQDESGATIDPIAGGRLIARVTF